MESVIKEEDYAELETSRSLQGSIDFNLNLEGVDEEPLVNADQDDVVCNENPSEKIDENVEMILKEDFIVDNKIEISQP